MHDELYHPFCKTLDRGSHQSHGKYNLSANYPFTKLNVSRLLVYKIKQNQLLYE